MNNEKASIWQAVIKLDRLVFTTREIAALTCTTISSAAQSLTRLEKKKILKKVMRGVWAMIYDKRFSPFLLVPFLRQPHQSYVSFLSALHIYGIIGQIPQTITVASTARSCRISTPVGNFIVHQLEPGFFGGFDWHTNETFLIAEPEKALVDCLYLAGRRGKSYASFPELEFSKRFSRKKARMWAASIKQPALRKFVLDKLNRIFKEMELF